jgi:hypothetical protein
MQTFTFTGNSSELHARYNPPIDLSNDSADYLLGLINFEAYNAIPNIDKGGNKFYIASEVIEIPTGSYELIDINAHIQSQLQKRKILAKCTISSNNNTLTCFIESDKNVDFRKNDSIGSLLGFSKVLLPANKRHESTLPVNIMKTNTIRIECNISTGAYNNDKLVHTLHEFFPSVPPGFKIIETPQNVIYMPINTKIIDNIVLKIVDQDGVLINFRGEVVTIRLHLKRAPQNGN